MSTEPIGKVGMERVASVPQVHKTAKIAEQDGHGANKELTMHDSKNHEHGPQYSHTVSTHPVHEMGEPGSLLDVEV